MGTDTLSLRFRISLELLTDTDVFPTARILWIIMNTFCRQGETRCSPTLAQVAERSKIMLTNVPKLIRNLEENGYLKRIGKDGLTNIYELYSKSITKK
jgi:DNA-binding IclR family transcriptional regulator